MGVLRMKQSPQIQFNPNFYQQNFFLRDAFSFYSIHISMHMNDRATVGPFGLAPMRMFTLETNSGNISKTRRKQKMKFVGTTDIGSNNDAIFTCIFLP